MRRAMRLIPMAAVILGWIGCGAPRPITYYTIAIPAAPVPSTWVYPVDILVGRISGPDLLESSPIVYKTGPNQIGTYQYHRWTESPVEMIQAKLIRLLRASGQYQSVSGAGSGSAELMVRGRLYDFAEVDGEGISGLVSMEFELYNRKTARVVWSHFYSQTEPVQAKQIPAVVQTLDRILDRGLQQTVAGLNAYFAANLPSKAETAAHGLLQDAREK